MLGNEAFQVEGRVIEALPNGTYPRGIEKRTPA
jgi:hypothetical protein